MKRVSFPRVCVAAMAAPVAAAPCTTRSDAETIAVAPEPMPSTATVDVRFQSCDVEMPEVVGGKFSKPYLTLGRAL